jgi:hypothetical protein
VHIGLDPEVLRLDVNVNGPADPRTVERVQMAVELSPGDLPPYGQVLAGVLTGNPTLTHWRSLARTAAAQVSAGESRQAPQTWVPVPVCRSRQRVMKESWRTDRVQVSEHMAPGDQHSISGRQNRVTSPTSAGNTAPSTGPTP